jgi:hypothetical protein
MRKIRNHFIPALCTVACLCVAGSIALDPSRNSVTDIISMCITGTIGVGGLMLLGSKDPG